MELEVQHENQTIILWLRSGCRADLSLLYETPYIGKANIDPIRRTTFLNSWLHSFVIKTGEFA